MNQIIISDLELNLDLDRQALNGVMGGQRRGGYKHHRKNRHHSGYQSYYYKEQYQEYYSSGYNNKHCYTPKFENYGCYC
jgi:hypothetical protein